MFFILSVINATEDPTEREVLSEIYLRYEKRVAAEIYKYNKNPHDIEDILHNVFLKVIKYRKDFIPLDEKGRKRLLIIYARSTCFDYMEKRKKEVLISSMVNSDGEEYQFEIRDTIDIPKDYITKEAMGVAMQIIDALPSPEKDIVYLKYIYDKKNKDIAQITGLTETNVSTMLSRTLKKIRKEMLKKYDTPYTTV